MKNIIETTKTKRNLLAALCFFTAAAAFGAPEEIEGSMRRYGIFIGSNNGGRQRTTLRYAVSDARTVSRVFSEMGGIAAGDTVLLVDPDVREVNTRIDALKEQVIRSRGTNKRTEIVFYYSGHSDEEGLLLNREKYSYRELRSRINGIPSDMRIVLLDSCASGAFTRIKGGAKTQPFLMDSSLSAEGYAFLTSSSASEASQESDRIGASYFTHSLVAGLRGAADSVGDGRVTLNELYRFAYSETLAQTETSMYGTQHPSYDIQVNGTGDVVLTDIKGTSAGMAFDENISGRLSIRDSWDHLVAEINKNAGKPLELGLEAGFYRITLQRGDSLYRAELTIADGQRALVTEKNFLPIGAAPARLRGGEETENGEAQTAAAEEAGTGNLYTFFFNNVSEPFRFPLIGFINIHRGNYSGIQLGFVNHNTKNLSGLQIGFLNTTSGSLSGLQTGFFNTSGDTSGIQIGFTNTTAGDRDGVQAGFVNTITGSLKGTQVGYVNTITGNLKGVQAAFINTNTGDSTGAQAGFVNTITGKFEGLQAGYVNTVRGSIKGPQAGFINMAQGFNGIQAGFVNNASGEGHGAQIGFVNIARKKIKGMQIGFVNYADSIEDGIPIGFFSIVKHGGYIALEYGLSEFHPVGLTLKSGVEKFYTNISFAYNPIEGLSLRNFAWGVGFGSIIPVAGGFFFNPELNHLSNSYNTDDPDSRQLLSFIPFAGFNFNRHFSVTAGPSVTWAHGQDPMISKPWFKIYGHDIDEHNSIVIGARASVRYRF